jgi:hypothetical protein
VLRLPRDETVGSIAGPYAYVLDWSTTSGSDVRSVALWDDAMDHCTKKPGDEKEIPAFGRSIAKILVARSRHPPPSRRTALGLNCAG